MLQARLPFLNMILYAGWLHGNGTYLTYTNIDIGVQAPFYLKVARQLQLMPDTPLSLIREEFEHTPDHFGVESALGWCQTVGRTSPLVRPFVEESHLC